MVQSYKDLPLRLYQTTRKYRDEPRPRKGLLRTREFTMKDLYTFDYDSRRAMQTYQDVRDAYARFFDSLKIRYIVAEADSGNMGGNLSHEYHLPSSDGEDHVVSCNRCGYAANEELAECRPIGSSPVGAAVSWSLKDTPLASIDLETSIERYQGSEDESDPFHVEISVWSGITRDRSTLVNVFYPSSRTTPHKRSSSMPGYANQVNVHVIKALVPDLDAGVEDPVPLWKRHFRPRIPEPSSSDGIAEAEKYSSVVNLFDCRLPPNFFASTFSNHADFPVSTRVPSFTSKQIPTRSISAYPESDAPLNLLSIKNGDACPRCLDGELKVTRVVEIGHTFHLGSRYSVPLGATVEAQPEAQIERTAQRKREDGSGDMQEQSSSSARFDDGEVKMAKGQVALQMGCHGLGISRIIGAVADSLADEKGLNWPRVMAPFEVVIIAKAAYQDAAIRIYDLLSANNVSPTMPADSNSASKDTQETLTTDVILDDRAKDFVWKMNDADLIGYPVIVVLGNSWSKRGKCEVQCRRLDNLRTEVSEEDLRPLVASLLREL
ncbi:MAG: hypothetical protein M1825_003552 [Sarcosagium campestre]|nr:MAG: hypothetical protein M1825_003552 [Sarcosagium campestre]